MIRIAIYHRYDYPNLKSRLKTYLAKLLGYPKLIGRKLVFINVYGGLSWEPIADFVIGKEKPFTYRMEISKKEWCEVREMLIIREHKLPKLPAEKQPFKFR